MTIFSVHFSNDSSYATKEIEATFADDALAEALRVADAEAYSLSFEPFEMTTGVSEITVCDEEGRELAIWHDKDWSLRLAAHDLLRAGRAVLARWEKGDLAEAVRELATAVSKAEGSA